MTILADRTRHLKMNAEERAWVKRHDAPLAMAAWKPAKNTELGADAVNGMTPAAQWGYKADASTRGALPKGWGKPTTVKRPAVKRQAVRKSDDRSVLVAELRAQIKELEAALRIATLQDDDLPVIRVRWAA